MAWRFLADGEFGPELRADLEVPDRGLKIQFSIRKNTEAGFPASHIIAVNTDRSGDLRATIASVPGIILKATEDAAGERLIGASTKVAPGYFWIALSGNDSDLTANMELLRAGKWIDLPLVARNGRRALLTFPKGPAGEEAMAQAFAAWDSLAKQ